MVVDGDESASAEEGVDARIGDLSSFNRRVLDHAHGVFVDCFSCFFDPPVLVGYLCSKHLTVFS